ncbi:MAG: hypothetical protein OCD76_16440 [Reichenbachiella sp.]
MKTVKHIFLFLALSLLMLHSIMPHQHHDDNETVEEYQEHQEAQDLLDYLMLAFHISQGEEHLEEFQVSGSTVMLNHTVVVAVFELVYQPKVVDESNTEYETNFFVLTTSESIVEGYSFRGPPSIV